MKTTLTIDDELLANISQITGINNKTTLIKAGLEALASSRNNSQKVELNIAAQAQDIQKNTTNSIDSSIAPIVKNIYQPAQPSIEIPKQASFEDVPDVPRQKLCELINHHGNSLCDEPKRCEALLLDSCGEKHKREVFLLVNALNEEVATNLLKQALWLSQEALLSRLRDSLHVNLGLDKTLSEWAVRSWGMALGKISESSSDVSSANSVNIKDSSKQSLKPLQVVNSKPQNKQQLSLNDRIQQSQQYIFRFLQGSLLVCFIILLLILTKNIFFPTVPTSSQPIKQVQSQTDTPPLSNIPKENSPPLEQSAPLEQADLSTTTTTTLQSESTPEPKPKSKPKPKPKIVSLTVRSNVYKDRVFINGKNYGGTPLYNQLPVGLYTLRVEKDNYIPFETKLNLQEKQTIMVRLRRQP